MRFFRAVLPLLSISFDIALLVVIILDQFNPLMGFLRGAPFLVLVSLTFICSVATAITLYRIWRQS